MNILTIVMPFLLSVVIYNYDTGDKLYELKVPVVTTNPNCYKAGILLVKPYVEQLRKTIPNASANVKCELKVK